MEEKRKRKRRLSDAGVDGPPKEGKAGKKKKKRAKLDEGGGDS